VSPQSDASYALAVSQCFLGVLLNVFMFTFVITKFQRPLAHVVLAENACVCTRGGELFVLVRVGNLRCNTLHKGEVTMTLLRRKRTAEGESYLDRVSLKVREQPRTLTAVATVAHKVERSGPGAVFEDLHGGRKTPEELADLLLQVVVTAYDPIYDSDVCAVKVYTADDFAIDATYAGVMTSDEKGVGVVNFDKIHDVQPVLRKVFKVRTFSSVCFSPPRVPPPVSIPAHLPRRLTTPPPTPHDSEPGGGRELGVAGPDQGAAKARDRLRRRSRVVRRRGRDVPRVPGSDHRDGAGVRVLLQARAARAGGGDRVHAARREHLLGRVPFAFRSFSSRPTGPRTCDRVFLTFPRARFLFSPPRPGSLGLDPRPRRLTTPPWTPHDAVRRLSHPFRRRAPSLPPTT
jgi:hypothetical protein